MGVASLLLTSPGCIGVQDLCVPPVRRARKEHCNSRPDLTNTHSRLKKPKNQRAWALCPNIVSEGLMSRIKM
jgi:hypothetical protein